MNSDIVQEESSNLYRKDRTSNKENLEITYKLFPWFLNKISDKNSSLGFQKT